MDDLRGTVASGGTPFTRHDALDHRSSAFKCILVCPPFFVSLRRAGHLSHSREFTYLQVANPLRPRCCASLAPMAKGHYRAWTPNEEDEYPSWVDCNRDLTWTERAKKYSKERKPRSKESLRTKYRLLQKDIRRHRHPIRKSSSRRMPRRQARDRRDAWLSRVSISTPSPSEDGPADSGPPRMHATRSTPPTRIVRPRDNRPTARMTPRPKATISPSGERQNDGGVARWRAETSWVHSGKGMSGNSSAGWMVDVVWYRIFRPCTGHSISISGCTHQGRFIVALTIPHFRPHAVVGMESGAKHMPSARLSARLSTVPRRTFFRWRVIPIRPVPLPLAVGPPRSYLRQAFCQRLISSPATLVCSA